MVRSEQERDYRSFLNKKKHFSDITDIHEKRNISRVAEAN